MDATKRKQAVKASRLFIIGTVLVLLLVAIGVVVTAKATEKGASEAGDQKIPAEIQSQHRAQPPLCKATDVEVQSFVSDKKFASGKNPVFTFSATNLTDSVCYLDFGTAKQKFVVKSGDALVWQSSDCQKPGDVRLIALNPKQTLKSAPLEWSKIKSDKNKCEGPKAPATAGTYRMQVVLEGATSKDPVDFILE